MAVIALGTRTQGFAPFSAFRGQFCKCCSRTGLGLLGNWIGALTDERPEPLCLCSRLSQGDLVKPSDLKLASLPLLASRRIVVHVPSSGAARKNMQNQPP